MELITVTVQVSVCPLLAVTAMLFIARLRDITIRNRARGMGKNMKITHLSYLFYYVLFGVIQTCNSFNLFTNCITYDILSIITLWSARFIFTLEMSQRAYIFFLARIRSVSSRLRRANRCLIGGLLILFFTSLLSLTGGILFVNNTNSHPICVTQYKHVLIQTIIIHLFIAIIAILSFIYSLNKLTYWLHSIGKYDARRFKLMKVSRKFIVLLITFSLSSLFTFICCIYVDYLFSPLIMFDGIFIICMDILIDPNYDSIFSCLCHCILPPPPRDQVKNLQQITDLIANKYKNEYEYIILKTLKEECIIYLSEDIIYLIMEYIEPITDLEKSMIYKPYWRPVIIRSRTVNQTQQFKYWMKSKYGGIPYLKCDKSWPKCRLCHRKLWLFLQLNMDTLPTEYIDIWLKNGDIYNKMLLQYFQCLNSLCQQHDDDYDAKILLRFIKMDEILTMNNGENECWKYCVKQYYCNDFIHCSNSQQLTERVIIKWNKKQITNNIIIANGNDNNGYEKVELYDFNKFEYETPSLIEYNIFCDGIFNGLDVIIMEMKQKQWNIEDVNNILKMPDKKNKLNGYYSCLNDEKIENNMPICKICNCFMNNMLYQLDEANLRFKSIINRRCAIFLCDNHPLQPQLVVRGDFKEQNQLPF